MPITSLVRVERDKRKRMVDVVDHFTVAIASAPP